MCFGQDPVSMNMPKAEILINSCEEEDWTLLLHPQRIALCRVCPRGRGLAWARAGETRLVRAVSVGQDAAEMHNRLAVLKSVSITSSSPQFPFSKLAKPLQVHCQDCQPQRCSKIMSQLSTNHDSGLKATRLEYVPVFLLPLCGPVTTFRCCLQVFLCKHRG